jgi:hypothetical protein
MSSILSLVSPHVKLHLDGKHSATRTLCFTQLIAALVIGKVANIPARGIAWLSRKSAIDGNCAGVAGLLGASAKHKKDVSITTMQPFLFAHDYTMKLEAYQNSLHAHAV